ncbi:hypothetical protein K458DRAFT_69580 [Lentithecium fluviatile CBS 122367]|uniref:Uncharacterized protein n=1 Tax=Lentithecium fluviatile CBS 122367 TaxID=1168545 RepID=A0A6G1JL31_9PLEO|nr:hypothetical protein K458DRAFT_69580 [Lentithecium fluviatile CBS 122367]
MGGKARIMCWPASDARRLDDRNFYYSGYGTLNERCLCTSVKYFYSGLWFGALAFWQCCLRLRLLNSHTRYRASRLHHRQRRLRTSAPK